MAYNGTIQNEAAKEHTVIPQHLQGARFQEARRAPTTADARVHYVKVRSLWIPRAGCMEFKIRCDATWKEIHLESSSYNCKDNFLSRKKG